ncbi:hypothetical protein Hanom_Chr03g00185871 [Helianthus anomalus]
MVGHLNANNNDLLSCMFNVVCQFWLCVALTSAASDICWCRCSPCCRNTGNLNNCSSFHKTPLLRPYLDRKFLNITRRASLSLYLSGSHDPILAEYKDLCRSKPIFGLLPPPLRNHTLNAKLIWLRVTFQHIRESLCSDTKLSRG